MRKIIALFVLLTFFASCVMPPCGLAQSVTALGMMPPPGTMVGLTEAFIPAHLKAMVIDPHDPFKFDFIINRGDEQLSDQEKQVQYAKLIKYFLAALAVPDTDQWVNLSPYEQDRIIPDNFGLTEMGRDLLAQDYLLKQIASSLTNPDTDLGKKFWDGVYARAYDKYGTTDIPADTFNKVWVIPDKAEIYEKDNMVYVVSSHLKVMLDKDYLATRKNGGEDVSAQEDETAQISQDVMREVIIPAIEQEVNTGRSFAPVRQVYSGMLLATWYKNALKESILNKVYADRGKVKGIDQDPAKNRAIYDSYVEAFKKGVFSMIKEDTDKYTGEMIPRKYFSGGLSNGFVPEKISRVGSDMAEQDFSMTGASNMDQVASVLQGPGQGVDVVNAETERLDQERDRFASLGGAHQLVRYRVIKEAVGGYMGRVFKSVKQMDPGVQHALVTLQRGLLGKFEAPYSILGSIAYDPHGIDKGSLSNKERREKGLFGFGDVDVVFGEQDLDKVEAALAKMQAEGLISPWQIDVNTHFKNRTGRRVSFKLRSDKPVAGEAEGAGVWIDVEMFAQAQVRLVDGQLQDVGEGEMNGVYNLAASTKSQSSVDVVLMKDLDGNMVPVCIGDARASIHLYVSNIVNEVALYSRAFLEEDRLSPKAIERWQKLVNLYKIAYPDLRGRMIDKLLGDIGRVSYDLRIASGLPMLRQVKLIYDGLLTRGSGLVKYLQGVNQSQLEGLGEDLQRESVANLFSKEVKEDLKVIKGVNEAFQERGHEMRGDLNARLDGLMSKYVSYRDKIDNTDDLDFGLSMAVFNMIRFIRDVQVQVNGGKLDRNIQNRVLEGVRNSALGPAGAWNRLLPLFIMSGRAPFTDLGNDAMDTTVDMAGFTGIEEKVIEDNLGGIDFAQSNLDMQIRRDGNGVVLPVSEQDLENIRIDGLVPVILKIEPALGAQLFR